MVTKRHAWIGGGPRCSRRGLRRVPVAVAVALGVFSCTVAGLPAVWAPAAVRGAVPSALAQLHWLVRASAHAPVPAGQIRGHFNAVELYELGGPAVVNQVLAETGALALRQLLLDHRAGVEGFVSSALGPLLAEVVIDTSGRIDLIGLAPNSPTPRTWRRIDTAVAGLAPQVSFAAMVIGHGGRCRVVNGIHAAAARPVGSAFKLYVLGAIARAVAAHRLSWNQQFALRNQWRSHGGVLVADAPGTRFTVRQYADYMISISDNTAATSLIGIAGRGSVQARVLQRRLRPLSGVRGQAGQRHLACGHRGARHRGPQPGRERRNQFGIVRFGRQLQRGWVLQRRIQPAPGVRGQPGQRHLACGD